MKEHHVLNGLESAENPIQIGTYELEHGFLTGRQFSGQKIEFEMRDFSSEKKNSRKLRFSNSVNLL